MKKIAAFSINNSNSHCVIKAAIPAVGRHVAHGLDGEVADMFVHEREDAIAKVAEPDNTTLHTTELLRVLELSQYCIDDWQMCSVQSETSGSNRGLMQK